MYIYVYIYHLCQRNNRNNTFRNNRIIIKIAQVSLIEGNSVFKGICMSTFYCQDILVFVDGVFITLTDRLTGLILIKWKHQRSWALIWVDSCWAYVLVCLHFCNWICIHNWRHFRSSYRKSTWVGIEPTTTAFCSDALNRVSYQAIRLTRVQSQVITATSISPFVQCSDFIFIIAFVSSYIYHNRNLAQVIPQLYLHCIIH